MSYEKNVLLIAGLTIAIWVAFWFVMQKRKSEIPNLQPKTVCLGTKFNDTHVKCIETVNGSYFCPPFGKEPSFLIKKDAGIVNIMGFDIPMNRTSFNANLWGKIINVNENEFKSLLAKMAV